jgi:hypothetical protein
MPPPARVYVFSASDPRGIRRVYGAHPNIAVAEQRCLDAAMTYVRRNPSSGPLELWTCKRELTLLGLSRFRWARQ